MRKQIVVLLSILILFTTYVFHTSQSIPSSAEHYNSIHEGPLILVNEQYHLQAISSNLRKMPTPINKNVVVADDIKLDGSTIHALQALFKAAENDGIHHFKLNSGYRSEEEQALLYEQYGPNYALPPGFSEHQTGYAVDIGSTKGIMGESSEGIWLANHAHQYGFILRYPAHKIALTGISFEPWHFRYVGMPHSQIMFEQDFVLEEYIEHLRLGKTFSTTINDVSYKVGYYAAEAFNKEALEAVYTISGDNIGGYIVTTLKNTSNF